MENSTGKYMLILKRSLSVFFLFVFGLMSVAQGIVIEDYMIYQRGDQCIVAGTVSRETVFRSKDASLAIQHALDLLKSNGGEVNIQRGDYSLNKPILLHSNTHLTGKGRATRLMVDSANYEGIAIKCINIKGPSISGIAITAGDNPEAKVGILIDNTGDLSIRNVFCVGFREYGLWMRNKSILSEISNSTFAGNEIANIQLTSLRHGTVGNFIPNLISDCVIYGGGKGIACDEVIVLNIVGCIVFQTGDAAFHIYNGSNSVLLNGCRTFQISSDAVRVEDSHELNVTGNIFCWHTGHGIVVSNSAWGTITGNNVIDNGSYNPGGPAFDTKMSDIKGPIELYHGIWLKAVRGYTVTGNAIFNWSVVPKMKYGILEESDCFKNILSGNNINYFSEEGVLSKGDQTIVNDNQSFAEDTYYEMLDLNNTERAEDRFWKGTIQSFQPELLEEYINSLK